MHRQAPGLPLRFHQHGAGLSGDGPGVEGGGRAGYAPPLRREQGRGGYADAGCGGGVRRAADGAAAVFVYGMNDDGSRLFPALLRAAQRWDDVGFVPGTQVRDHCAVDDVAAGVVKAAAGRAGTLGVFNLGSGRDAPAAGDRRGGARDLS